MILIGQYDPGFVRRTGIALRLYGIAFEHRPWSTFGDAAKIRPFNPLVRVPVLVLDTGEALSDSALILDHLDQSVEESRRMTPPRDPERYRALRITGLATGLMDKNVSLFYERRFHKAASGTWANRCRAQIEAVLRFLEKDRAQRKGPFWFGEIIGHADIAVACALQMVFDLNPDVMQLSGYPALAAHAAKHEAMPVFQEIRQEFIPPA